MSLETRFEREVPPLPKVPDKIQMYKVIKPPKEEKIKHLLEVASSFGLKGGLKGSRENQRIFILTEGDHNFEIFKESGAIWYGNMSELWEERKEPVNFSRKLDITKDVEENKRRIEEESRTFLRKHNLLPEEAHFSGYGKTITGTSEKGDAQIVSGIQANFDLKLGEIPVAGPGAKISVNFGQEGKIIGFFYAWRGVGKDVSLPLVKPEDALNKFWQSEMFTDLGSDSVVKIERFELSYYARPVMEQQDYLLPVYAVEGITSTPYLDYRFTKYIPAVSPDDFKEAGIRIDLESLPDPDLL